MNLLLPDSGLIFWMALIFAIVFFVLAKFGFPVITGMVEKRNARISDALEAARKAEEALAHLNQEQERIMAETREEQALLKKEAAAERERMIAVARDQAQAEAQKIMDEAKARIKKEQEERDAQAKARAHVTVNIPDSSEIVKKNLEAAKNGGKR